MCVFFIDGEEDEMVFREFPFVFEGVHYDRLDWKFLVVVVAYFEYFFVF